MEESLVSVIMTTYKREPQMVKRAIRSVLNQSYKNIEFIIVDDSPETYIHRNNVAAMIHTIPDKRIIYIQNEKNEGACVARNIGIKRSKGEYIIYFDDDDELMPNKIKYSLKKFHSNDVGLVYSQHYTITNNKKPKHAKNKMVSGFVFSELIKKNFVAAFPLIRRECFENCGFFDPEMKSKQDYELWLRIAQKYKFEYVKKPLSKVYFHKGERISSSAKNKIQGSEQIYIRYQSYLNKHKSAKNERLMDLAMSHALDKDKKNAKKYVVKAIMAAPYRIFSNFKYMIGVYKRL